VAHDDRAIFSSRASVIVLNFPHINLCVTGTEYLKPTRVYPIVLAKGLKGVWFYGRGDTYLPKIELFAVQFPRAKNFSWWSYSFVITLQKYDLNISVSHVNFI